MSTDEFRLPFVRGTLVEPEPYRDRETCDLSGLERHARGSTKPIAVDLFCGAGGLSLGLREAGFDVILGVDYEQDAVMTHGAYFGGVSHLADLSDEEEVSAIVSSLKNVNVDLIAGGPPCQPFSRANARMRSNQKRIETDPDERAGLWKTFVSIIGQVRPKAVLFENVPDLAFSTNGHVFMEIVVALEDLGYSVRARILNSTDYGIAQTRQRLFIVAIEQGDNFCWPSPNQAGSTLADAIGDLPPSSYRTSNPTSYQESSEPSALLEWLRRGMRAEDESSVYDHTARRVRDDDLEIYLRMEPGQIYNSVVPTGDPLRRYGKDDDVNFKDRYKRLSMLEPCRSITAHIAKDGYWYIHPEQDRTLTVREAARVQSFPDWFRFHGYPTAAFRQIGNSVPPLLSKALAEEILRSLETDTRPATEPGPDGYPASQTPWSVRSTVTEGPTSLQVQTLLGSMESDLEHISGSPWLYSTDPWKLILGIVFADQVKGVEGYSGKNKRLRAWSKSCDLWPTPEDYISYPDKPGVTGQQFGMDTPDKELFRSFHISEELDVEIRSTLQNIAEWRRDNPDDDFTAGIDRHVPARFKNEISSLLRDYNWSRLPSKTGPIRVADRLYGYEHQRISANSRLNLTRALARARDRRLYLAFCEIADLHCLPGTPVCDECPFNTICMSGFCDPEPGDQYRLTF